MILFDKKEHIINLKASLNKGLSEKLRSSFIEEYRWSH